MWNFCESDRFLCELAIFLGNFWSQVNGRGCPVVLCALGCLKLEYLGTHPNVELFELLKDAFVHFWMVSGHDKTETALFSLNSMKKDPSFATSKNDIQKTENSSS